MIQVGFALSMILLVLKAVGVLQIGWGLVIAPFLAGCALAILFILVAVAVSILIGV